MLWSVACAPLGAPPTLPGARQRGSCALLMSSPAAATATARPRLPERGGSLRSPVGRFWSHWVGPNLKINSLAVFFGGRGRRGPAPLSAPPRPGRGRGALCDRVGGKSRPRAPPEVPRAPPPFPPPGLHLRLHFRSHKCNSGPRSHLCDRPIAPSAILRGALLD